MGQAAKHLPDWPYAMDAEDAAAFCGIEKLATFKRLVRENTLPNPFMRGTKAMWLKPALEQSLERLHADAETSLDNVKW